MGKYKSKLKKKRIKRGGFYRCEKAPFVTNWQGEFLETSSRNKVTIGDSVRIVLRRKIGHDLVRYITITKNYGQCLVGIVNDPYYGNITGWYCDVCGHTFMNTESVYYCLEYSCLRIDYFECEECYKKTKHQHELLKYPFQNGTVVTFNRSNIMEIPGWTNNTRNIGKKYLIRNGLCRGVTGCF
jgi:hypothetical protein